MNKIIYTFFLLFLTLNLNANSFKISSETKVITTDSTKLTKNAALELQKYLQKILGKPIKIYNEFESVKNSIVLIQQDSKNAKKFSFYKELKELKKDSFIIRSEDENIIIAGTNHRALFYGVYHFLQKYLECKFLTKDFEIVPKNEYVVLNRIDDVQTPYFLYREFFSKESDDNSFAIKSTLNGRLGHRNAKVNVNEYFPKGMNIYNEFVSSQLIKDASFECNGQYDFSKDKVAKLALNSINEKLKTLKVQEDDYILLEHEDRESYCTNGLKKDDVPTLPFLKYSSKISENISDKNVIFQAYQWSRKAPKTEKLPKNLSIFFSPIEADFSKPFSFGDNKKILKDLKDWNEFGNDIFIWHYVTNFGGYFQPFPNIYALDKDIKLFSTLQNVKGIFLQSSYGTFGGELEDLRTWVFAKLLWNPNANIDSLIKEFCDAYYGEASEDVQKYIRVLHKINQKTGDKLLVKSSLKAKYLHEDFLVYLEDILEGGLKKLEDNSSYKTHFLKLFSGVDYVRVMRGGDSEGFEKSRSRFKEFLNTKGVESFSESGDISNIKEIINLKREIAKAPKEAKGLKEGVDWFDFCEYELKLCCVDLVEDKSSSDGVSARIKGELGDWGFQLDVLNFPKGKWKIYASVKVEFQKDVDFSDSANIALHYGIHPTFVKGVRVFGQFEDGLYQNILIGTIDTSASNAKTIWLSPSKNPKVKFIYVDRIFVIRDKK